MALSLELWRRVLFVVLRSWGVTKATAAKSYSCVLTPQCDGYLNRRDLSPPPGGTFRLPSASCGVATKSRCRCPNGWSTRPGAISPSTLLSTTRNEPARTSFASRILTAAASADEPKRPGVKAPMRLRATHERGRFLRPQR